MDNRPIGVFDSGVGGLTLVKEIKKILPNEKVIYYGDTERAPYGTRKTTEIISFSKEIVNFLLHKNCKIIVIACNTITVAAYKELSKNFDVNIIEVVTSGIKEVLEKSVSNVAIIGTKSTINSRIHYNKIKELNDRLQIQQLECSDFITVVESGNANTEISDIVAKKYLKYFDDAKLDTILLACTHFPFMKQSIQKAVGKDVLILDPSVRTVIELNEHLLYNNMYRKEITASDEFYCTGKIDNFTLILKSLLDYKNYTVYKITNLN